MIDTPSTLVLLQLSLTLWQALQLILIGVLLGAVPSSELANILIAFMGKKLGVEPGEITSYNKAASSSSDDTPDENTTTSS